MLNKENNKAEIIGLYSTLRSSDAVAEILQEKYELYNTSLSSLSRKIRKWLADFRAEENPINKRSSEISPAKILVFDIETSPLVAYLWSKWQNGVNDMDIIQDWSVLCFSAKWLFENKRYSFKMTKKELETKDDSRIAKELWKLLDEADIVIAHNGKKFDIKKANSLFIKHKLLLPSSYQVIDTLLHARSKFGETSNTLNFLAEKLGLGSKLETPKGMWHRVMEGNYKMLEKMSEYCDKDVDLLEEVYLEFRPYIQPHPNIGLFVSENVQSCTCCGSTKVKNTGKSYATTVNTYDLFRCDDCGSLMRSRQSNMPLSKRKSVLSSVPQ